MINNIIFGLFVAVASAATHKSDFVCPEADIAATGCKGPKDCLYPYLNSCNKFIQCEVNADGVTGRPVVKDCPEDLEWNDNIKMCDWAPSPNCDRVPSSAQPSTTRTTTTTPEPTTSCSTDEPPSESGFVCPKEDIAATGCKGLKDCLYPDPNSCNNYIMCTIFNGVFIPLVVPCLPFFMEWNDRDKRCDFPSLSTCPKT